jgi:hypothetical protein
VSCTCCFDAFRPTARAEQQQQQQQQHQLQSAGLRTTHMPMHQCVHQQCFSSDPEASTVRTYMMMITLCRPAGWSCWHVGPCSHWITHHLYRWAKHHAHEVGWHHAVVASCSLTDEVEGLYELGEGSLDALTGLWLWLQLVGQVSCDSITQSVCI